MNMAPFSRMVPETLLFVKTRIFRICLSDSQHRGQIQSDEPGPSC